LSSQLSTVSGYHSSPFGHPLARRSAPTPWTTRARLRDGGLLLGQRGEAQVGLDDAELGEELLGLLVLDGGVDDDVVAGDPVDGGGDLVLVAGLERVDDAQDLGRVAAGGGRVGEDGADGLLGVDDEDGADGEGDALFVDVCGVLVVEHVVGVGDLALLVGDDGELDGAAGDLGDVLDPALVGADGVGREADELDAALGELGLELGDFAELGGADGRVVLGVREEDDPVVADELVEVDGAVGRLGLEVGRDGAEAEAGGWTLADMYHHGRRGRGETYGAGRGSAIVRNV
jgi:hypothetical protein